MGDANWEKHPLSWVPLPFVEDSDERCTPRHLRGQVIADHELCAGADEMRDSCPGESGSPLVFWHGDSSSYYLAGLQSYGILRDDGNLCRNDHAVHFTEVRNYFSWIAGYVEGLVIY